MSTSTTVYVAPRATKVHPLLAAYLARLTARPLQTKMTTAGVLCFLQEVLANHIAGVPFHCSKDAPVYKRALAAAKVNAKALNMALYGFFISAPMHHVLIGGLHKLFAGRTSGKAKLLQLLVSNLFIAPVQASVYLASMAVIGGARSADAIQATVMRGFLPMLKILWLSSPTATLFAQSFLPPELWVPFFNVVSLVIGTFFSVKVKRMQLSAARKAKKPQTKDDKTL
ncbi:related to membrane protein, peroxisomal [Serendipita indica DSM 11827]|uniref:Related to membrane protein, peroxisomal n=1 Tax=Serendipita indica (strain DSM 11827) TaxID=1109443 RepID=G4TEI5_SERID|nr:related to membrane protein, peroxisomal [Serendipita indica DSM 11827]